MFVELGRYPQCDIHIKWKLFRLRSWRKRSYDSRMALLPQISSKVASAADGQIRNQEIDSDSEIMRHSSGTGPPNWNAKPRGSD